MANIKIKDINLVPLTDEDLSKVRTYLTNRGREIVNTLLEQDKKAKALTLDEYDALNSEWQTLSELSALFNHDSYPIG